MVSQGVVRKDRALLRAVLMACVFLLSCGGLAVSPAAGAGVRGGFESTSWEGFQHGGIARLTAVDGPDSDGEGWLRLAEGNGVIGHAWSSDSITNDRPWSADILDIRTALLGEFDIDVPERK